MKKTVSPKVSYLSKRPIADCPRGDIFCLAGVHEFGEVHVKNDETTGLRAIVAIHSTRHGASLGGTRCVAYDSVDAAFDDAMRLARGMSYKSAFFGLPYGGGKGVLIKPACLEDRDAYFEAYGDFIETLQGRFITAVDSGTTVEDMDRIAHRTRYVVSTSHGFGDPSPYTAYGVCRGMEAAVQFRFQKQSLEGIHVVIQGVGRVGYHLAKELYDRGARLTVCDFDTRAMERCVDAFRASVVSPTDIYETECDIFAPCALGAVINEATVDRVKAAIICGAANNQLASETMGERLYENGILYAPDYVANGGGLMHAVPGDKTHLREQVAAIYDALLDIFEQSSNADEPTHRIADRIAEAAFASIAEEELGERVA